MAKCTGILISSAWYRDPVDPVIDGSSFRSRTIRGLNSRVSLSSLSFSLRSLHRVLFGPDCRSFESCLE